MSLTSAYKGIFDRLRKRSKEIQVIATKVLSWIFRAMRSLRMGELLDAIAIEEGKNLLSDEDILNPDLLIEICEGLMIHDRESDIVRFAYHTVREILEEEDCPFPLLPPIDAARSYLTYLLFEAFSVGPVLNLSECCEKYKFFQYAAQFWALHVKGEAEESSVIRELLIRMLCTQSGTSMSQIQEPYHGLQFIDRTKDLWLTSTALHIVARNDLLNIVKLL